MYFWNRKVYPPDPPPHLKCMQGIPCKQPRKATSSSRPWVRCSHRSKLMRFWRSSTRTPAATPRWYIFSKICRFSNFKFLQHFGGLVFGNAEAEFYKEITGNIIIFCSIFQGLQHLRTFAPVRKYNLVTETKL